MKKFSKHDLRRSILDKSKLDSAQQSSLKVNSPLAKYDNLGNITCIICKTIVKSVSIWKVHANSRQHKNKVEIAKQLRIKLLGTSNEIVPGQQHTSTDRNRKEKDTTSSNVPATINSNAREKVSTCVVVGNDVLPEKFFDDPVKDARVRNTDYKDSQDDEWERFQREIKEESTMSNAMIAGEQDEAAVLREIEEIDDQMNRWNKFIDLEEKKKAMPLKGRQMRFSKVHDNFEGNQSSEDSDSFDEFSNWRSKTFNVA